MKKKKIVYYLTMLAYPEQYPGEQRPELNVRNILDGETTNFRPRCNMVKATACIQ